MRCRSTLRQRPLTRYQAPPLHTHMQRKCASLLSPFTHATQVCPLAAPLHTLDTSHLCTDERPPHGQSTPTIVACFIYSPLPPAFPPPVVSRRGRQPQVPQYMGENDGLVSHGGMVRGYLSIWESMMGW